MSYTQCDEHDDIVLISNIFVNSCFAQKEHSMVPEDMTESWTVELIRCVASLTPAFQIITLSDLECDYINATQCCSRLNKVSLIHYMILQLT